MDFLRKLFDTSKRDVEALLPLITKINGLEAHYAGLSDEELKAKASEFKAAARGGTKLDDLMPDVFAIVREASKRTLGMRQFDVQMIGGAVLHQGRIAEMKTGEGKTLVAVAPIVLNALDGKGAHLVTVNDYLARRDAVWMGPIYHFLGLSVGIIQGQSHDSDELGGSYLYTPGAHHEDPRYMNLVPCSRREAYGCDITYGTNHEFGFDYLRDNMSFAEEDLVMRELNYAMIDEVDSILIDEARTPHIISGPSVEDTSVYKQMDVVIRALEKDKHYTSDKKNHSAQLTEEGMDEVERVLGIDNIASHPKLFHHANAAVKAYALFDKNVDYVVRGNEVVIVDENTGRMMVGRRFSDGLHQALEAKEGVPVQRESQTIATITFQNLFRLYNKLAGMTGTAKTEEDEFRKIYGLDVVSVPTHRPLARVDQPDIIYKSTEAKFRGISWELLRLYTKQQPVLVGTRSIEMSERVSARLTSDMLQKLLIVWRLRELVDVKKSLKGDQAKQATEIFHADLDQIKKQHIANFLSSIDLSPDVLKGDWAEWFLKSVNLPEENKVNLEEALKHGIPHNVLNAKYHEREAVIIAEAGRKGQVTIATNMAGRGVDILLGGRVEDDIVRNARQERATDLEEEEGVIDEYADTFASYRRGGKERAAPPLPLDDQERKGLAEEVRALGGLFILGTERHESRRIDNQLRGRAGRQGDPGESRYFVSLEDTLWKIFNANMMDNPVLKMWPPMEEVNAGFLSKLIARTQERIENHFFESRKHVLEYDDVLNAQREDIYASRREVLLGKDARAEIQSYIPEIMAGVVENAYVLDENDRKVFDHALLFEDLNEVFPAVDYVSLEELEKYQPGGPLEDFVTEIAIKAYNGKIEANGDDVMKQIERQVLLHAINDRWMEHLQTVDYIREGIGLRGYGQVDPLIAYKRETFDTFVQTKRNIHTDAVRMIYRAEIRQQQQQAPEPMMLRMDDVPVEVAEIDGFATEPSSVTKVAGNQGATGTLVAPLSEAALKGVDWTKVGRNDVCPCGSGKKFKACHYPQLRAQGVI
jgi:preprotein translocase subunit SecA